MVADFRFAIHVALITKKVQSTVITLGNKTPAHHEVRFTFLTETCKKQNEVKHPKIPDRFSAHAFLE